MSIPFSIYDFFAYLSSGSVLFVTFDYVFGNKLILSNEITTPQLFLFIVISYALGHIIGNLSSSIIEHKFVRGCLGIPISILMGEKKKSIWEKVFPNYYRSLPTETQKRIEKEAKKKNFSNSGESLFIHTFSTVCQSEMDRNRLDELRNMYGFSRNMILSLITSSILFLIGNLLSKEIDLVYWALFSFIAGIGMLFRYLKFYRQYSYQLLIIYSEFSYREK